jgi:putative tryptophan/tyrosine transport system substrate-binding protein
LLHLLTSAIGTSRTFRNVHYRRAGAYAARIIKGAKPGDLPVEQADKFKLVINLKTAKQLGINVPANLLTLADELIE